MTQHDFLEETYKQWRKANYHGAVPANIGNRWTWQDRIHALMIGGLLVAMFCLAGWMVWGGA